MRTRDIIPRSRPNQTRKWMLHSLISQSKCQFTRKGWTRSCMSRFLHPIANCLTTKIRAPSIESLKRAMQTYARQGGTSSIFVNDDGLRLLPPAEAAARLSFYATHNIGWVARPAHTFHAKNNAQGTYFVPWSVRVLQYNLQDLNVRVVLRRHRT